MNIYTDIRDVEEVNVCCDIVFFLSRIVRHVNQLVDGYKFTCGLKAIVVDERERKATKKTAVVYEIKQKMLRTNKTISMCFFFRAT